MEYKYDEALQRVASYRKGCNLTQKEMGERLGITQSHYSKMELGKVEIPYRVISQWVEMDWDVNYFVTGKTYSVADTTFWELLEGASVDDKDEIVRIVLWSARYMLRKGKQVEFEWMVEGLRRLMDKSADESLFFVARRERGITQSAMADSLGIGVRRYRQLEKGTIEPDLRMVQILYQMTGYEPALFWDYEKAKYRMTEYVWVFLEAPVKRNVMNLINIGRKVIYIDGIEQGNKSLHI